jgi:hypothetical protein
MVLLSFLMLFTTGCNWFDGDGSPAEYTVGGTVTGLTDQLTLQNNAADDLVITADGPFEFATPLIGADDYAVTIGTQPDGQSCTVTNAAGRIGAADVTNVEVSCVDLFTGLFVDDLVLGLDYTCSSGKSSKTTTDGQFTCPEGDDITFWLGSNELGPIPVAYTIISPILLFPDDGLAAINLARLMQSLDSDLLPDNGVIVIDDGLVATLPANLDFSLQPDEFEAAVGITLVSLEAAIDRLRDAIAQYIPDNAAPIADAGADRDVVVGSTVSLSGAGSTDANGDGLTFHWNFVSTPAGSGAALASKFSVAPSFVADVAGSYVVGVLVSDGTVINYDIVVITANDGSALPAAPVGLQAVAGDARVTLSWTAVDGATGYMILFNTTGNMTDPGWVRTGPITGTAITFGELINGTTHFYWVAAVNASGEGPMSARVSATPEAVVGSNDADLIALSLTSTLPADTLTPAFDSNITSYTATVGNVYSWIDIRPTASDSNATITVEIGTRSIPVNSGSSSGTIGLNVGENLMSVVVTAEAGNTKTYSLTVTRLAASTNADLSALVLSDGVVLAPVFNATTTAYTATVASATDSITVTPYTFDAQSTVTVNGATVASGAASSAIALSGGANTISIVVTAGDGSTSKTYTVMVTRDISTYTVGGTVSGLAGTVTLQNNGADALVVATNGSFTFATAVDDGSTYAVTVSTQPTGQTCSVTNGDGTISGANVSNVGVSCVDVPTYTVGGIVTGLTGTVTLQNSAADDLVIDTNSSFTFDTAVNDGGTYLVTVSTQPTGQSCGVTNNSGTISGANVTDVIVTCIASSGGTISDWKWATPLPQGNIIADMVWSGAQFVGVGDYGTVITSPLGEVWTVQNSGTFESLRGIVWQDGQFIAVGTNNTIISSDNGIDWVARSTGDGTNRDLNDIIWGDDEFVAVGKSTSGTYNDVSYTSPNGVDWTSRRVYVLNTPNLNLVSIAWNGSMYMAIRSTFYVYTSPDAVTWTRRDRPYAGYTWGAEGVAADTSQFVVVGDGYIQTTPDGVTWTTQYSKGDFPAEKLTSITWDGTKFLTVGTLYTDSTRLTHNTVGFTSFDGTNWVRQVIDSTPIQPMLGGYSVVSNGSQNVVAGIAGIILTSQDAETWTSQYSGLAERLNAIVWNDNQFVAVGGISNLSTSLGNVRTSPDGITWTTRASRSPDVKALVDIIWTGSQLWTGSQFVAVTDSGVITASSDAIDWRELGSCCDANAIASNGSLFVAVGSGISSSVDGSTWVNRLAASNAQPFWDVVWTGDMFVAVGGYWNSGVIATSINGIDWTTQDPPVPAELSALTWTGSQLVAVGKGAFDRGLILTSYDGTTWTAPVSDLFGLKPLGVTSTDSGIVVIGDLPIMLISRDGVTWEEQAINTGLHRAITFGNGRVVVVRYDGGILTNDTL